LGNRPLFGKKCTTVGWKTPPNLADGVT